MRKDVNTVNELLFFATILTTFGLVVLIHYLFGKDGLYAWIAFAVVFANILVTKCIRLFGMEVTLGNVLFGTVFLCTDMLNEMHSYRESRRGVYIGLFAILSYLALSQLGLRFIPSDLDTVDGAMQTLFALSPRVCLASVSMFLFSNLLDVWLFQKLKKATGGGMLWLRNNLATCISQVVENFFFHLIAFGGFMDISTIVELTFCVSLVEVLVALCDTPFLYLARRICSRIRPME